MSDNKILINEDNFRKILLESYNHGKRNGNRKKFIKSVEIMINKFKVLSLI